MLLHFEEKSLKTRNIFLKMDRTPFISDAKITFFIIYKRFSLEESNVNSKATDAAFRESLLKLKMYL